MKPKIFIGSSTEALDIAYAIQENLEHYSNPTVWTQGIFSLSINSLDNLIKALSEFDYGIFVFKPDDISIIRNSEKNTARDNVIFELGLFIGKLGKERVYFVTPRKAENFHLPTDLLGITPGTFDNERDDGNLKAALGPFCNQVRLKLANFVFENLSGLEDENDDVKSIVIEKNDVWEYMLSSKLLRSRLIKINESYEELEKGLVFQKSKTIDFREFLKWFDNSFSDFNRLMSIFIKVFQEELIKSFGEPGVAGSVHEIKNVVNKIISICQELLEWEYELQGIVPPEELTEVIELMKGWTKVIFDEINKYPDLMDSQLTPEYLASGKAIAINLEFPPPPNSERIMEIFDEIRMNMN